MGCAETNLIVMRAGKTLSSQWKKTEGPILYLDGFCPFGSVDLKYYVPQDRSCQRRSIDVSAEDSKLGSGLICSATMRHFHVGLSDGALQPSARVFMVLWAFLSEWQWVAQLAKVPGIIVIVELACHWFLRVRALMAKMVGYFGAQAAHSSSNKK